MKATFMNAWGYQGDNMNLPVADLDASIPFYVNVMGFTLEARNEVPHRSVILGRDGIHIGLAENGGDPAQDGCAFQVDDCEAAYAEFHANGLQKEMSEFKAEKREDGSVWRVFYIVAPDGLCFWMGEKI